MISTIIIAVITAILLILSILLLPKIRIFKLNISTYWIVALIGAILMMLFGDTSLNDFISIAVSSDESNPIKILILFFSMTFLSIFLDEVGLFSYLAKKAVSLVKNKQIVLFLIIYFMVAILTIFTSNDIVILTFTPFICYFTKASNINPIPYLVGEFVSANTWSMMLLIGNPTNIYLSLSASINFINYFKVMSIPTIIAGIVQIVVLLIIFNKYLKEDLHPSEYGIKKLNKLDLCIGLFCLIGCLILLIISNIIGLEMYIFSLSFMILLFIYIIISSIIRKNHFILFKNTLKRLPYELIPFVLGMEIIVLGITNSGILNNISTLFGDSNVIFNYGISSCLMCNIINNIPMSILYSSLCNVSINTIYYLKCVYSSIIGSNIGAFITPLGALAGIMFTNLLDRYNVKYGFSKFIKYGIIVAIPTLFTALLVLSIIL